MANAFLNLPVPPANGVGAAVDTSSMGGVRTITAAGDFGGGNLIVEVSNDGGVDFVPLVSFNIPAKRTIAVAAQFMRVRMADVKSVAAANCDVACNDDGGLFANLPAPAADGVGAAVDVSALGTFNSVAVTGVFTGNVIIEVSEDNVTWNPWKSTNKPGVLIGDVVAQFMRVRRLATKQGAAGLPEVDVGAINDATPGGAGGGTTSTFIYQPGGGGVGPVVYQDWATLVAALDAARVAGAPAPGGKFEIQFDDAFVSPVVIPAGGPWNMENVTWVGKLGVTNSPAPPATPVYVSVTDGATFTQLRRFKTRLFVFCDNETIPVSDIVDGDVVEIRDNAAVISTGGPNHWFFDCSNVIGGQACRFIIEESVIGDGINATIRGPAGAEPPGELQLILMDGALVQLDAIEDGQHELTFLGNSARVENQQPTGSVNVIVDCTPRWNIVNIASGTVVAVADFGAFYLCDPSGANITINLPNINPYDEGLAINVKSVNATMPFVINVVPSPGETIDGVAATYTITVPYASVTFVSDGAGGWWIL